MSVITVTAPADNAKPWSTTVICSGSVFISKSSRRLSWKPTITRVRRDEIAHGLPLRGRSVPWFFVFVEGLAYYTIPPVYAVTPVPAVVYSDVSDDDLHMPPMRARMRFISPQTAVTAAVGLNSGGPNVFIAVYELPTTVQARAFILQSFSILPQNKIIICNKH